MKFNSTSEAKKQKLIGVTEWLLDNPDERSHIERLQTELNAKGRITMAVKRDTVTFDNKSIALFANNVAKTSSTPKVNLPNGRAKSTSGLYKNVRHLCECAFAKSMEMTFPQFKEMLKKEFPHCAAVRNGSYKNHYYQYRHKIVIQWQFQYIEKPKWAR